MLNRMVIKVLKVIALMVLGSYAPPLLMCRQRNKKVRVKTRDDKANKSPLHLGCRDKMPAETR